MNLIFNYMTLGPVGANCYVFKDEESGRAFVVDPAHYGERLKVILSNMAISEIDYILLTHGHFDHIGGAERLRADFGGKIVIGEKDSDCLFDSSKSLGDFFGVSQKPFEADITVKDGSALSFADGEIRVLHTPGHTVGGVCYLLEDFLFTGDTLFSGSVGRTDFPGGSSAVLSQSLRKIAALRGNYKVLPGHEDITDLETERNYNPYMKGMYNEPHNN